MPVLDGVRNDLRHTFRQLRRAPAFTATAVLTLAIGVGATTAIFSLVQQVMLRSLPVSHPERLWRVGDAVQCCYRTGYGQDDWNFFSWEAFTALRDHTAGIEELTAFQVGNAEIGVRRPGAAAIATASGQFVSGNFFRTLGVPAWRGRLLADADDRPGAQPVAVMAFHAWQARYGSDPSVVGATIGINGRAFTVAGIAPPGFYGVRIASGSMPDFWLPLALEPAIAGTTSRLEDPRTAWLDLIGRIPAGTDPRTVEAQLQVELHAWLGSHMADMTPQERAGWDAQTLHLTPGGAGVSLVRAEYEDALRLLFVAAACVLLVACANIANLLLARGLRHRHQIALRAALGAPRERLVRQALTESLALAVLGAGAGIVVAYGGVALLLVIALGPPARQILAHSWVPVTATPSMPIVLFAIGISTATGLAFSTAPIWMTLRADPIEALRGLSGATGGRRHRAQRVVVVLEVAVSLVLLCGATMLGQSFRNLQHQSFGFQPQDRYLVYVDPTLAGYQPGQLLPLVRDIEDRLRAIPGVRLASPALYAPMSGYAWSHGVHVPGEAEPASPGDASSSWARVTPRFFDALGNRIVAGRGMTDDDNADARPVAVINEAFARRFFGTDNPIGRYFGPASRKKGAVYEVVGVAADMRYFGDAGRPIGPMYFVPEAQSAVFDDPALESREVWSHYPYNIVIWAPGNPAGLEAKIAGVLADLNVPLGGIQSYAGVIRSDFSRQNMIASLTALFGFVALALAAVGLYGVTAYGVEQRTSEIGVRMALGAGRRSVIAMVLRGAFWQVASGVALGIPAAIGAGLLIANQLFGVRPWDPLTLAAAPLLLLLTGLVAAGIPARRAATVDPSDALRTE